MPKYDISPRDRKLQRRAAEQEMDIQAQQADTGQLGALLQQMATMYGLQQQQQMAPEQLRALRAGTDATVLNTQLAPKLADSEIAARGAGVRAIDDKIKGEMKPVDRAHLWEVLGLNAQMIPREAVRQFDPQSAAAFDEADRAEIERKAALRAADQAQQAQQMPVKPPTPPRLGPTGEPLGFADMLGMFIQSLLQPTTAQPPRIRPGTRWDLPY